MLMSKKRIILGTLALAFLFSGNVVFAAQAKISQAMQLTFDFRQIKLKDKIGGRKVVMLERNSSDAGEPWGQVVFNGTVSLSGSFIANEEGLWFTPDAKSLKKLPQRIKKDAREGHNAMIFEDGVNDKRLNKLSQLKEGSMTIIIDQYTAVFGETEDTLNLVKIVNTKKVSKK